MGAGANPQGGRGTVNGPARADASVTRMAAVAVAGFCAFLPFYAPQPLLPTLAAEFRTSVASISLLLTASTLGVALVAPIIGILADRIGRKRIIVPAALLLGVPSLLVARATSVPELLFWRFWQGVVTPGIVVVAPAYINEEWQEGVGRAMGAYVSGTVLGGFFSRLLAGLLAEHFSWRWAFVALALLALAGGLAVWAWLPASRGFRRERNAGATARAMARHLRNPRLLATYAVGFCVLFSMLATFTYVNFYLAAPPFNLPASALGSIFVVYLVAVAVTPLTGGWIRRFGRRALVLVSSVVWCLGLAITLVPWLPAIILGLAILACAGFTLQTTATSLLAERAIAARSSAVGIYVSCYYIGGSAGAVAPAVVWAHAGWLGCVALVSAVLLATAALAARFWRPTAGGS